MAEILPGDWATRIQKLHQDTAWRWLWLIDADINVTARTCFQLVAAAGQVSGTFFDPTTKANRAMTFYPTNMSHSVVTRTAERNLPQMELRISGSGRALHPYFEQGSGFMGMRATVFETNLADLTAYRTYRFRVAGARVTSGAAVLRLALPNYYQKLVPEDPFNAQRCRWRFGSEECGYVINGAAAFLTCPKHIAACVERGEDMASRNLPALQPMRFGGFLGIPAAA